MCQKSQNISSSKQTKKQGKSIIWYVIYLQYRKSTLTFVTGSVIYTEAKYYVYVNSHISKTTQVLTVRYYV